MNVNKQHTDDTELSPYELQLDSFLHELIEKSVAYKEQIDSAKTNLKREMYKKKLHKNNQRLFELMSFDDSIRGGE